MKCDVTLAFIWNKYNVLNFLCETATILSNDAIAQTASQKSYSDLKSLNENQLYCNIFKVHFRWNLKFGKNQLGEKQNEDAVSIESVIRPKTIEP